MTEIIPTLAAAIGIAGRLKTINDRIRNAEFHNLLADLNINLAEAKSRVAELIVENTDLKLRLRELDTPGGEPCPRCRQRTWHVADSRPALHFGQMGVTERTYKCSTCGLTEAKLAG